MQKRGKCPAGGYARGDVSYTRAGVAGRRSKRVHQLPRRYRPATFIDVLARHGPPAISRTAAVLGPHTATRPVNASVA